MNRISWARMETKLRHMIEYLAMSVLSAGVCIGLWVLVVDQAVPDRAMPSSYKWLLLEQGDLTPRIIVEGGSSGHHGIDTDLMARELGMAAIDISDNAGYDLRDKVARLQRFAHPGDHVVLQLEWSYYLRDSLTDDYLSVLFSSLPDYYRTQSLAGRGARAMTVPAPALWAAYHPQDVEVPAVLSPAQQMDLAAIEGPSGHVAYDTARPLAEGVAGQSCDSYLFGAALKQGPLRPSPLFRAALGQLQALRDQGVVVHFAWPIVVGDDCYTSQIGLETLKAEVEAAVHSAGFDFLGQMAETRFGTAWRDDTPYHLIAKGAEQRTRLLIAALRAEGVGGPGAVDVAGAARNSILAFENAMPDPLDIAVLPVGQMVGLGEEAAGGPVHFVAGWWQGEGDGRWMRGKEAVVSLRLPEAAQGPSEVMVLEGLTFGGQSRRIGVFQDGRSLAEAEVADGFALDVPTEGVPRGRPVRLTLRVLDDLPVQSPRALGQGDDLRSLSLRMTGLRLGAVEAVAVAAPEATMVAPVASTVAAVGPGVSVMLASVPAALCVTGALAEGCQLAPDLAETGALRPVALGQPLTLGAGRDAGLVRLGGGWWGDEADGRWIGASAAALTVMLPQDAAYRQLRLLGQPFAGADLPVEIAIGDEVVFAGRMGGAEPVVFTLPEGLAGQEVTLTLRFAGAELACPTSRGLGADGRVLVAFIRQIDVVTAAQAGG